jgi:hypothetical protein
MPGAYAILGSNPSGLTNAHVKKYHFFPLFYRLFLNQSNLPFNNQLRQTFSSVWIVFFGVAVALSPP